MPTVHDKMENVKAVGSYLEKLKDENLDFVVLPEMFCCPYQTFPQDVSYSSVNPRSMALSAGMTLYTTSS